MLQTTVQNEAFVALGEDEATKVEQFLLNKGIKTKRIDVDAQHLKKGQKRAIEYSQKQIIQI